MDFRSDFGSELPTIIGILSKEEHLEATNSSSRKVWSNFKNFTSFSLVLVFFSKTFRHCFFTPCTNWAFSVCFNTRWQDWSCGIVFNFLSKYWQTSSIDCAFFVKSAISCVPDNDKLISLAKNDWNSSLNRFRTSNVYVSSQNNSSWPFKIDPILLDTLILEWPSISKS